MKYPMTVKFNTFLFSALLKHLRPVKGEKILDIGCGQGYYVKKMEDYADVRGIDTDKISVKNSVSLKVGHGDATNLPFKDKTFDKVYCLHVVEHIKDTKKLFSEMARVLKPSGLAIVVYPAELIRGISAVVPAIRIFKNPFMASKIHIHKFTPKRIEKNLKGASLSVVKSKFVLLLSSYLTILKKI